MTPREPDRFDKQAAEVMRALLTDIRAWMCGALKITRTSLIERIDEARAAIDATHSRTAARCGCSFAPCEHTIRALIPPAAAPESQRDTPCGGCGHPLWWHQWSSKEHAFCCAPLDDLQRDYCRCKNYEAPAAAPAAETGKAQGAEALTARYVVPAPRLAAAEKRIAELEAALRRAHGEGCICVACEKMPSRAAPAEREGK